jgi:hypothetical protein
MRPFRSEIWERAISERAAVILCVAALAALVPLVFASALNDFLLSDSFRLVGQIDFSTALTYFHQTAGFGRNEYRPVMLLTYAWDNFLWQSSPWGYHLTNVLLHTVNGILLLLVLRRLMPTLLTAFTAAALYSFHPAHHSRVGWIAARDSEICLFFLLLAWFCFLLLRSHSTGRIRQRILKAASGVTFVLALLSYEGAVAFPFAITAVDLLLNRSASWQERVRRTLRSTAPYFVLLGLYIVWWMSLFHGAVGGHDLEWTLADFARDFYRMHYRLFANIQHWQGLLYLIAGWWIWKRRPRLGSLVAAAAAILWLGFLPFVLVHGYADRFGFFSALGVALLLSLCVSEVAAAFQARQILAGVLPLVLVLTFFADYTRTTQRRLEHWREAGQLAESMMAQLKAQRPVFPADTELIFDQVPMMHGEAYVFPTGFRAALRRRYGHEVPNVSYFPAALDNPSLTSRQPRLHFRFQENQFRWTEISADSSSADDNGM